jgi:predicted transcriptional regulator
MAGFDKALDKELYSEKLDFDRSRITVAVFAYNNGTPKLQISRENKDASGEFSFAKLGRMTKDEVEKVMPLMEKAKKFL